jgi:hypothetical protein
MAAVGGDERAPIQIDDQQLKKNPLWNHVVLLERAGLEGMLDGIASIARVNMVGATLE